MVELNQKPMSRPWLYAVLIALVALFAYSNTFNASFHFDDEPSINRNPGIKDVLNMDLSGPFTIWVLPQNPTAWPSFLGSDAPQ